MLNVDENTITNEVLARLRNTPNPRLKFIMSALIRHLHDFAREVRLTEAEWLEGIKFLTDAGHITDDKRQEFILLSDTLGLSILVTALNSHKLQGCTEATLLGPFYVTGAPEYPLGADIANGARGEDCYVDARVRALNGKPIGGALVQVWQSDAEGFYDVQDPELRQYRARAVFRTDPQGRLYFKSILPVPYPIPNDGPVGRMLKATARHPMRPAHMHFMIEAPGYERLVTHVFRDDDPYLDSDAVFAVRSSLVCRWESHRAGAQTPAGISSEGSFHVLRYEFVLQAEQAQGSDPPRDAVAAATSDA